MKRATPLIAVAVLVSCATEREDIITEAAMLNDEFAIAVCADPMGLDEQTEIRAGVLIEEVRPYSDLVMRHTGTEWCDVLRLAPYTTIRIRMDSTSHTLDELHVYRIPPGMGVEDPETRRPEFVTIRKDADSIFRFRVVTTEHDMPTIPVGRVRSGHPLLVPVDGLY